MTRIHVLLLALMLSACGRKSPNLDSARAMVKAGKHPEALVHFEKALAANPDLDQQIREEAEVSVKALLPLVKQHYEAGAMRELVALTTKMRQVRTQEPDAYLYEALARLRWATNDTEGFEQIRRAMGQSLNHYMSYSGILNQDIAYPAYMMAWLLQQYGTHRDIPHPTQRTLATSLRVSLVTGESLTGSKTTTIPGDIGYVMRCRLLRRIALAAIEGAKTDADKADALFAWVTDNVQSGKAGREPIPVLPFDAIFRGYGAPEQLAWIYVELARQVDLPAVMRLEPYTEDAVPPATGKVTRYDFYASALVDKQMRSYDLWRGVVVKSPPSADAVFLVAVEPKAFFPRMQVVDSILKPRLEHAPRLYSNAEASVSWLVENVQGVTFDQDLKSKLRFPAKVDGKPTIDVWAEPLRTEWRYRIDGYRKQVEPERVQAALYVIALRQQYFGDRAAALALYDKFIAQYKGKDPDKQASVEDCSYLRARCLELLGRTEEAVAAYRAYLSEYAKQPSWGELARMHLGRVLSTTGKAAEAKTLWAQISGPRKAWVAAQAPAK